MKNGLFIPIISLLMVLGVVLYTFWVMMPLCFSAGACNAGIMDIVNKVIFGLVSIGTFKAWDYLFWENTFNKALLPSCISIIAVMCWSLSSWIENFKLTFSILAPFIILNILLLVFSIISFFNRKKRTIY